MISVLCPTYGRSQLLNEMLECFLRQSCTDAELIILNDCPQQRLSFVHPRVEVLNRSERFATFGEKKNHLITLARNRMIALWDDDDIYLPGFLTTLAGRLPRFRHGRAAKPSFRWYDAGGKYLVLKPSGYMNDMLVDRDLLIELGGFAKKDCDEEISLLHSLVRGKWLLGPGREDQGCPQYIYRTHSGRMHVTDTPTEMARAKIHEDFERAVADGSEPVGDIALMPHWKSDYAARAVASWEHHGAAYANAN